MEGSEPTRIVVLPKKVSDQRLDTSLTLQPGMVIPLFRSCLCGLIEGETFRSCVLEPSKTAIRLEPRRVLRIQLNDPDRTLAGLLNTNDGKPPPSSLYNLQVKWTQRIVCTAQGFSTDDELKSTRILPVQMGWQEEAQTPTNETVVIDASSPSHQVSLWMSPQLQEPTVSARLIRVSHSLLVSLTPVENADRAMATFGRVTLSIDMKKNEKKLTPSAPL